MNSYLRQPLSGDNSGLRSFCWTLFISWGILLLALLVLFFFSSDPELELRLMSVSVPPFNVLASAYWNISLLVENPKYNTIFYDGIHASLLYKNKFLSSSLVAPFYQLRTGRKMVEASITVDDWMRSGVFYDITTQGGGVGVAEFDINVFGLLRVHSERYSDSHIKYLLLASCSNVKMVVQTNVMSVGTMVGGSRNCDVFIKK